MQVIQWLFTIYSKICLKLHDDIGSIHIPSKHITSIMFFVFNCWSCSRELTPVSIIIWGQGAGPEIKESKGSIQARGSQSSVNDTIVLLACFDFPV